MSIALFQEALIQGAHFQRALFQRKYCRGMKMANFPAFYASGISLTRCVVLAAILLAFPAVAHHSAARFDTRASIEVTGVVQEFAWKNPHAWIKLDVDDGDGNLVMWEFEGNGATYLLRTGWRRSTIKPGDTVTIVGNPLKSGQPGGRFYGAKLPDGRTAGLTDDGKRAPQDYNPSTAEQQL